MTEERNYYQEAMDIINKKTSLLPEYNHLYHLYMNYEIKIMDASKEIGRLQDDIEYLGNALVNAIFVKKGG